MPDFPSLLYKGLRILMFQLSGVYCMVLRFKVAETPNPVIPESTLSHKDCLEGVQAGGRRGKT